MKEMIQLEDDKKLERNTERIIKNQERLEMAFWEIGELLNKNKEIINEGNSRYKSFEQYFIEQEFSFSIKHAWKIMKAVINCKDSRTSASMLGLGKLLTIAYVPDAEIRETLIKKAITENLSRSEIDHEVQEIRMSNIGKPLDYMDKVENKEEEYDLKISRDYEVLKGQLDNLTSAFAQLKTGYDCFIEAVSKRKKDHPTLIEAKKDKSTMSVLNLRVN